MYSPILISLDGSDRALAALGPGAPPRPVARFATAAGDGGNADTRAEEIDAIVASGGDAAAAYEPGGDALHHVFHDRFGPFFFTAHDGNEQNRDRGAPQHGAKR